MLNVLTYFDLRKRMKTSVFLTILFPLLTVSFLFSYILNVTMSGWEQYVGLTCCILLDGLFGILAGIKNEGFMTFKALKIIKTWVSWLLILTVILITEKSFPYANWLSEVMVIPVITFMLLSALKNGVRAKLIKGDILKSIMDKIDKHKDI
jgi:hypothetical protein